VSRGRAGVAGKGEVILYDIMYYYNTKKSYILLKVIKNIFYIILEARFRRMGLPAPLPRYPTTLAFYCADAMAVWVLRWWKVNVRWVC
jgi:hypothetical protein